MLVHGNATGQHQVCCGGGAAVTDERAAACGRDDDLVGRPVHFPIGSGDYAAHAVVPSIGDQESAGRVERDVLGERELRADRGRAVSGKPLDSGTRYGRDEFICGTSHQAVGTGADAANSMSPGFRDEQVAVHVKGDPCRREQRGRGRGQPVPDGGGRPAARNGRDDPGCGVHASNAPAGGFRDEQVVFAIESDEAGLVQLRAGGGTAIACRARETVACDRRDQSSRGVEAPDTVIPRISDVEIPTAVHGDIVGQDHRRRRRRAAIAPEPDDPAGQFANASDRHIGE